MNVYEPYDHSHSQGLNDEDRANLAYAVKDTLHSSAVQQSFAEESFHSVVAKSVEFVRQIQSVEDLKSKLLFTTLELESLKANAKEEMKRNEEKFNHLNQLLLLLKQERDEAKDLLNKMTLLIPSHESRTQITRTAASMAATSGTTESDSFSETPLHHFYVSSPMDHFLDTFSSPDPSALNIDMDYFTSATPGEEKEEEDPSLLALFSQYAKKLPEKGKFMQAVLEAGPLLQTLLVSGLLPKWRNPPPLPSLYIPRPPLIDQEASIGDKWMCGFDAHEGL